jgi:PAS domain-containing protein
MESKNVEGLQSQLDETKEKLNQAFREKEALRKAIWDLLNYANIFVLLLDDKLNIVLINYRLATKLGFNNEKEAIGRCWLDFIKPKEKEHIYVMYHSLYEENHEKYRETVSEIVKLDGTTCLIKWFNFIVSEDYRLIFRFGIPKKFPVEVTEESLRSYYKDILLKDKTMIDSLKDMVIKKIKTPDFCDTNLGGNL